jgi:hypothetical protein
MSDSSLPDDPAPASEPTRRPRLDRAHPEQNPSTDYRGFAKLQPGAPLPPGIAPDAQRYSWVVIEEARAGKEAVRQFVPDADGEYVEASREMFAEYFAQTLYSVPARIFFGALAAALVAMVLWWPVREFMTAPVISVLAIVAALTFIVITGKNPFFEQMASPSFLRLADPSVPLADDDLISRPPGDLLGRPASRVGPVGGEEPPSRR